MVRPDIYTVGSGTVSGHQLTREAIHALEQSETILTVHHQELFNEFLDEEFDAEVVDMIDKYETGQPRVDTYGDMAQEVLAAAEEADGCVTFITYGHPTLFVDPVKVIDRRAIDRGLEHEILPGISSLDTIYVDLRMDPGDRGLQIMEATQLMVGEHEPDPHVPLMLLQIGAVETYLYAEDRQSKPEQFTRIREYLQQFYPDDHEVRAVRSATFPTTEPDIVRFELDDFEDVHDRITHLHTLYVPERAPPPVRNEKLHELAQSEAHLDEITRDDGAESS